MKARQQAKLQKATEKGKPQAYLDYKASKIKFTQNMIKQATLISNLKKVGMLP